MLFSYCICPRAAKQPILILLTSPPSAFRFSVTVSDVLAWLGLKATALAWLWSACGLAKPKPRPSASALAWLGLALAQAMACGTI